MNKRKKIILTYINNIIFDLSNIYEKAKIILWELHNNKVGDFYRFEGEVDIDLSTSLEKESIVLLLDYLLMLRPW